MECSPFGCYGSLGFDYETLDSEAVSLSYGLNLAPGVPNHSIA
jgi:hypothetical protein